MMNIIVFFNFIIFVFLSLKPMQNALIHREQIPPMINNKKILSLYIQSELLKGSGILLLYPSFYLAKSLYARNRREQSKSFSLLPLLVSSGIYLTSQAIRLGVYFDQAKKIINNEPSLKTEREERINQRKKSFNNKILSAFNIFQKTNTEDMKNYVRDIQKRKMEKDMEKDIESRKIEQKRNERLLLAKAKDIFNIKRLILDYSNEQNFRDLNSQMNQHVSSLDGLSSRLFELNDYKNELKEFFFNEIKFSKTEYKLCKMFFLIHWLFEDETENKKDLEEFIKIIKNRIEDNKDSLTQKTINSALLKFREKYIFDLRCPENRAIFFDNNLFFPLFKITAEKEENEKKNIINTIINLLFIESHHFFVDQGINSKGDPLIKFLKDNHITYQIIYDHINNNKTLTKRREEKILSQIDYLENLLSE